MCYSFVTGKPNNTPPGLLRLPLWGSYWFLLWGNYKFPHETIAYYVKKFKSKIISCYLGNAFVVIVNDYAGIKEVLNRKEFDGRAISDVMKIRAFGKTLGIFFNDAVEWHEQRRFALRNMRDFGFGRRHQEVENNFVEELTVMLDTIDNGPINNSEKSVVNGDLVYFPNILYPTCVNMLWSIMSGERFDRSEHDILRQFCIDASIFQAGGDTTGGATSMTAWLRHFGDIFSWKSFYNAHNGMINFFRMYLEKHGESLTEDEKESRGFMSTYLCKMKNLKSSNEAGFSVDQMLLVIEDFMFPAASAVPTVITNCIKYMMHYPEVMKKVQAEIDHVVGRGRVPKWDDRKDLIYTEATIREVMRIATITPLSVAHRAIQNTKLFGYDIPVDTIMMTNLTAMHNDPDTWGDPENFRPERFLNDQGQLGKDYSMPFGNGKRLCAGETFARFMVFGMFATLVQHYDFSFVDGEPMSLNDKIPGIIVQNPRAWIKLNPRH
ncbi:hypothetical protein HCN44_003570 [Aphidius gifuensis]|uniref:Cytochrome P450 n=2 Tax=Aphidius gifuensis TaxID=684658 RepID=A0A835CKY8_APHGI|nr:hypothetical protein HCN44_003570 [Aphidius gifuensis]